MSDDEFSGAPVPDPDDLWADARPVRPEQPDRDSPLGKLRIQMVLFPILGVVAVVLSGILFGQKIGFNPTGFALVGLGSVIGVAGVVWLWRQHPPCAADAVLVVSYRTNILQRTVMAELPTLWGIIACVVTNDVTPMLVGVLVTVGLLGAAQPSDGDIRRVQKLMDASGCDRRLRAALLAIPPGTVRTPDF